MDESIKSRLPLGLLALDLAGMLMLGAGIAGAMGALDPFTPMFQDRMVGYVFAGLGLVLIALAIPGLIRWAKTQKAGRP